MTAIIQHAPGEAQIPAPSANLASGKVLIHATLGACVVEGVHAVRAQGDPIHVRYAGIALVPAASATTFAADANVQINTSTNLAVTSGGTHIGRAVEAKTSGQTSVRVLLNAPETE